MSRTRLREILDRATYALALLPVLTDFIDTGHWPSHPREVATEVVLGPRLVSVRVSNRRDRAEMGRSGFHPSDRLDTVREWSTRWAVSVL